MLMNVGCSCLLPVLGTLQVAGESGIVNQIVLNVVLGGDWMIRSVTLQRERSERIGCGLVDEDMVGLVKLAWEFASAVDSGQRLSLVSRQCCSRPGRYSEE